MKISRLRLHGFKSFVDPTDLLIEPGLTGVVGPNGCGKSNLLEALRWVMGETSHKNMRAAAMDDVIFSGTTGRPARNSAEVTIFLDNRERTAPETFNDREVIEVTRRIEREAGSAYRINGKEERARDIKLLFEDAATGARSPALVRQGQISEIVNAKPEARRRILEDAAGTAGLHSRRHDAELRLKAAEANLARVTDILGGLKSQAESLKRQARQARRYKEISAEVRRVEALAFHLAWTEAQAAVDTLEARQADVLEELARTVATATAAEQRELERSAQIAPLREAGARTAETAAKLAAEIETLDRDSARARDKARDLEDRLRQIAGDHGRETALVSEANDILVRLDAEMGSLKARDAGADTAVSSIKDKLQEADTAAQAAEAKFSELTHAAAERRARLRALETSLAERKDLVARSARQIDSLDADIRAAMAGAPDAEDQSATAELGQKLGRDIAETDAAIVAAEDAVAAAVAEVKRAREEAQKVRLSAQKFSTERETLARLLQPVSGAEFPPVTDDLRVAPGYETALGAALGDDLDAPLAADAPVHWRGVEAGGDDPALPADVEPLLHYVQGPPELARRLRQIGIVTRDQGHQLQRHLRAGQRLVSLDGDLWRWDGFVAAAGGITAAAQRLATRNRLNELDRKAEEVLAHSRHVIEAEKAATDVHQAAEAEVRRLRAAAREMQSDLAKVRDKLTTIERKARETDTRLAGLKAARAKADETLRDAQARLGELESHIVEMSKGEDLEPGLRAARSEADEFRAAAAAARIELASLEHEREARANRLSQLAGDAARWHLRRSGAEKQIVQLTERQTEAEATLSEVTRTPVELAERRQAVAAQLEAAEQERRDAIEGLNEAEIGFKDAMSALRQAQSAVSSARELKAGIEAKLEATRQRRQEEARKIRETLGLAPEACLTLAGVDPDAALPPLADVERDLAKLRSDRERLGGVNLEADDELGKVSEQMDTLGAECTDIEQAIAKLRGAITQLNREGKKRLEDAFVSVDGHFRQLFTTLFGGGEARLEMVASEEDPLEGGLEIIAKPPGKKPATLSLLSGGEQTLTALSLIFAVFLSNPSPICVLDEVDAPLDDANVDRFCRLMEHMASDTDTRFLVITHHPMTMSRMNRLFGVTMMERGVSQLVSVDLETAQSFREAS